MTDNLKTLLADQPKFRSDQIKQVVYVDLIDNWQKATSLPLTLRERLKTVFPLEIKSSIVRSKDGKTAKALITLQDGAKIETVLMRYSGRNTVCISSQVGCPLGCLFCATGKMGFKRNLDSKEIIDQVLLFARDLVSVGERVNNVVFMGMGEPFLNWDNVWEAINILNDQKVLAIGARHISLSSCGIIEGINRLANETLQINLAISLHAPNQTLRRKLIPIAEKNPLDKLIAAIDNYIYKTKRKVMFEYIMIDGVNDTDVLAKELAKLLNKPLYMVNLIAYNNTGSFKASPVERIAKFRKILFDNGLEVTQRYRFGTDIKAACGQLAGGGEC